MVQEVGIPRNDLLARLAELPILRVVEGAVDGAAGYGAARVENAWWISTRGGGYM